MTYEVKDLEVGRIGDKKFLVRSALMPRARFLELVEEEFERSEVSEETRAQLRPIAATMPRYPLGKWIHEDRGCGCVVGEFLVATEEMSRAELMHDPGSAKVVHLLAERPNGEELKRFGYTIDEQISHHLSSAKSLISLDGSWVRSVEIID